ncbi:MAG: hypothetical protein ABIF85_05635 [Nanoarchaeota archaeon]|nr:hypothetical protein [Nanoarchaeota archaeon]MBU4301100.1 hypothetical protein [Nanoarchaeota archaeon]MBU4451916.1 hypothetical protein [Nanoarchaeota archaeon]MCG2724599.1 hypothetical protein [archaeon]
MVMIHKEKMISNFNGTIIDIETIGNFNKSYEDSRRYANIVPVIFGYMSTESIQIHCAKNVDSLEKLKKIMADELSTLRKPFYAFNSDFERSTFFHSLNKQILFEGELNKEKFEPKWRVVTELKIPQYNDPFNDVGLKCSEAWQNGNLKDAIAHNRSCLLKERDILLKRGFRSPDNLKLIKTVPFA